MSAWWSRVRGWSPHVFLAIGLAGLLVYAFPGYMSNDSYVQLMQARTGVRNDMNPPLMALEWSVLDAIITGPLLMLLLQGVLALWGLHRILRQVLAPRSAAVAAMCLLWFPPILTTFGVIWKDSQMAAYLLVGIACLLDKRRWVRLVGLAAMVVGCAMRHNALAATLPAVVVLFEWKSPGRWWRRYAISLVVSFAVVAAAFTANRLATVDHQRISPAIYDIVGIVSHAEPMTDTELREILRDTPLVVTTDIQAHAKRLFTPRNPFWYSDGPRRIFDQPTTDLEQSALLRAWKELVFSHWGIYLKYRWRVFRELIGDTPNGLWSPVWAEHFEMSYQPSVMHHAASRSPIQTELMLAFSWLADESVFFEPMLYLWLALALLALCCRDRLSFALLASGLGYELGYFPIVATPDYRYSHWLILCTCCAAVVLFARRLRAR